MTKQYDLSDSVQVAIRNTIGDALRRSAGRQPAAPALQFEDRIWSYQELDLAANRVANGLLARGLQKGDRVAAYGKNSDAYVLLWLACARAGLIHVPVNYGLVQRELTYICNQSGARALFCDDSLAANVEAVRNDLGVELYGSLRRGALAEGVDILALAQGRGEATAPDIALSDDDVVQILYTSGTTSDPKGAMHTHRSLMAEYQSCLLHLDISGKDRGLAALPLYHSAQMHVFLMPSLLCGAFNYLIDAPVPDQVLALIEEQKITSFFSPPTVWIGLLRHPDFDRRDLSTLENLYYGASIMPEPIVHELAERLPQGRLFNCYGQSEIAPMATVLEPHEHADRPSSCGRPLTSVETRVVKPGTLEDCAPGEQGEIVHRSPHLMVAYWDKPEETEEAFKGGWFHSGDLAYQDEQGYLYIVDRIKDVVNTGGVLVASRDVEEALYGHESVAEVAVIGVPHEKWIESIVAVVVVKEGKAADAAALIDHARQHLAPFKVPKAVHFVEALPKNTAGKLLKRTLREQYAR
ncbi:fatty acyl-CoA synthetase [Alcanivorax sp. 24]|uniref:fatty acyl-CoA synthetase n=1 Tax=Alcanivorax sp. 24 TaxID=2545266 RepID=UPI0010612881|nr:fatty acyl-CoA synthetase [Alcanivorax sp. 24]